MIEAKAQRLAAETEAEVERQVYEVCDIPLRLRGDSESQRCIYTTRIHDES